MDWFLRNGDKILSRGWLSSPIIQPGRARLVQKSRKDFTCVLGCQIPKSSRYVCVDLLAGGGCGASYLELAVCTQHAEPLAGGPLETWLVSLDGEDLIAGLGRLSAARTGAKT